MASLAVVWLWTANALAVEIQIFGKPQRLGEPALALLQVSRSLPLPQSVGQITVDLLKEKKVPFEGGVYGISNMFELGQDVEVISDNEMLAYGWCFELDGVVPETMADQTLVLSPTSRLIWFYAYAHYKNGQWIAQCRPAGLLRR